MALVTSCCAVINSAVSPGGSFFFLNLALILTRSLALLSMSVVGMQSKSV